MSTKLKIEKRGDEILIVRTRLAAASDKVYQLLA
jgi:hypothetical protein